MKRYYTIDAQAIKENDLSVMEWLILENIQFMEYETGYCYATKKDLADHHDITYRMYRKYISRLVEKGWIKQNKKGDLKTSKKWFEMMNISMNKSSHYDDNSVNKSSHQIGTKVHTLPIKKEIKRDKVSVEEISNYIKEKNLSVDAQQFFDYFEAGNWIDSKGNKVKNWKQKLLTWNKYQPKQKNEEDDWSKYAR